MDIPVSIEELSGNISRFMIMEGAALPEHTLKAMIPALSQPSPVDSFMRSLEILYAARQDLSAEGKKLVGQIAGFAIPFGWHGINEDNRGQGILRAMSRDLGEPAPAGGWPDPESDPEPKEQYLPPKELEAPGGAG
jgi:hypothetical protein